MPKQGPTVVRQGSIPHGTSIMAQGNVIPTIHGGPYIQAVDSTPFNAMPVRSQTPATWTHFSTPAASARV